MIVFLSASALWLFLASRTAMGLYIFAALPATAAHELAHWIIALITGSSPSLPSLWPTRIATGWQLGSVRFNPGWLSAGWVALAPLWCLAPAAAWGVFWRTPELNDWHEMLQGVLWGYVAWGSLPSSQDWLIALRYPVGTLCVLASMFMLVQGVAGTR